MGAAEWHRRLCGPGLGGTRAVRCGTAETAGVSTSDVCLPAVIVTLEPPVMPAGFAAAAAAGAPLPALAAGAAWV